MVGVLLLPPLSFKPEFNPLVLIEPPIQAPEALIKIAKGAVVIPEFPDMASNLRDTVTIPKQQAEAEKARVAAVEAAQAVVIPEPVQTPVVIYEAPKATYTPSGGLTGSYGYSLAGGNCVNQVPSGLRGPGNPISWSVTSRAPYIGAAALFYYNHVVRVTGIWSNGDIEVANENWNGPSQTRFSQAEIRGYR